MNTNRNTGGTGQDRDRHRDLFAAAADDDMMATVVFNRAAFIDELTHALTHDQPPTRRSGRSGRRTEHRPDQRTAGEATHIPVASGERPHTGAWLTLVIGGATLVLAMLIITQAWN